MMFDVLYGLRKWRGAYLQWLLLALGFALFTALLAGLLQLKSKLMETQPPWVNVTDATLVTVGRNDIGEEFTTISAKELAKLDKLPQIDDVARIGFRGLGGRLDELEFNQLSLAFYSDNLAALLQLPAPFVVDHTNNQQQVFISHRFWQQQLSGRNDTQGLTLTLQGIEHQWAISGVLPPSMDAVGRQQPDIWLPLDVLSSFTFVDVQLPDTMPEAQRIATAAKMNKMVMGSLPMYYAIAGLNQSISTPALLAAMDGTTPNQEDNASDGGIRFNVAESEKSTAIVPGVQFNPSQQAILAQQWWLLLILVIGFGIVNAFNLFTVNTSRLVARQQEFALRFALGGRSGRFFGQLIAEHYPLMVVTLVCGWLFNLLMQQVMLNNPVYNQFFGGKILIFDPMVWLSSSVLIVMFIIFCACLPLLTLLKRSFFSRAKSLTGTKGQFVAAKVNAICQVAIALFVITLATAMVLNEWARRNAVTINQEMVNIKVTTEDAIPLDANIKAGRFGGFEGNEIALSNAAFVSPGDGFPTVSMHGMKDEAHFVTRDLAVTPSYFELLALSTLAGESNLPAHGVIINRSTADRLKQGTGYGELVGQTLTVRGFNDPKPLQIMGVVENPPHFGIANSATPVIYTHLSGALSELTGELNFFASPQHIALLTEAIETWAKNEVKEATVTSLGSINAQLAQLDSSGRLLFRSTVALASLICALVLLSLYYQVRTLLQMQVYRYGTMMAIGASPGSIQLEVAKGLLLLTLLALPVALTLVYFAAPWFEGQLEIALFSAPVAIITVLVVATLVQLVGNLPGRMLTSQPIAQLLRYQG